MSSTAVPSGLKWRLDSAVLNCRKVQVDLFSGSQYSPYSALPDTSAHKTLLAINLVQVRTHT